MRYKSKEDAQKDHIDKYRSDGVSKMKGTRYSSDYFRVHFLISEVADNAYVLDVGCNGGTLGIPLMRYKNCYVKGIDIVPELVEKAKKRGIFAEVGEAEDLSRFKDNEFDFVLCAEVLEHLYDPLPAIKEAYRVLKDGGKYLVTIPHPNGEMARDDRLGDFHHQNFSMEIIDTLFHQCFKQGNVSFIEIGYGIEYCNANNIPPTNPQWIGLVAKK